MAIPSGTKLGPYEIQSVLGVGGMGEVYCARDSRLSRTVAIKVLPERLSSSLEAKQRFEREARTISSLNHPHICQLYDIGSQNGMDFLVMEFLEGETLAERLRKGALQVEQCLRIASEICEGLEKAHRGGVVHRDLKPANIFLTQDGHVKLLDFGLARISSRFADPIGDDAQTLASKLNLTSPGTAIGTVAYMSPEQARGEAIDERSDLFSLGVVLYEMCCGRRPFEGATSALIFDAILNRHPQPLSDSNLNLPATLGSLLNRLMAKNSCDRWSSAREAVDALREIGHNRQTSSASGKARV
jgi:eukaryotic-like serine/threonine-protein kinase